MEEEFEELAEYLDQCYERARKLSDALTNHPDLKYSRGESYPLQRKARAEPGVKQTQDFTPSF